ncbi:MAG: glycerophosphodiester phosphodiesterase family protein [Acholeplasmatales bacterium]
MRVRNDIFILSRERKIIKKVYSIHPYARLVYEPKKTYEDLNKLTKELFSLGIFTICLDISYANQKVIRELKKHGIVVIIRVKTQLEAYEALLSGVDGILGKDIEKIKINNNFYTRPFLVSHRGYQINHIENSLGAAIDAEKLGAEFIELDIHLTKNNVVVVNHGASLGKNYDKDWLIRKNTFKELKGARQIFNGKVTENHIESLINFDKEISNNVGFILDIKVDNKSDIKRIAKVVNLMERPVYVMSFLPFAIVRANKYLKKVKSGMLLSFNEKKLTVDALIKLIHKYNLVIHPYYLHKNPIFTEALNKRMIPMVPYALSKEATYEVFLDGYHMVNSDYIDKLVRLPKHLIIDKFLHYKMGEYKKVLLTDEKNTKLSFKAEVLFDNPLGLVFDNLGITSAEKPGVAYAYLVFEVKVDKFEVKYASDLITIKVYGNGSEINVDTPKDDK